MIGKSNQWPASRGLRVLGITYGLASSNRDLIVNPEFFEPGEIQSLITNWSDIEHIPYSPDLDATCHFLDDPDLPFDVQVGERELFVQQVLLCAKRRLLPWRADGQHPRGQLRVRLPRGC